MIILKRPDEIKKLRESNLCVAYVLERLRRKVKPGITTLALERLANEMIRKKGVKAAFKGYRGYPYSLCTSVNEEVVHGMPSERVLQEGDVVSIDFGVFLNGYYGDAAITVGVGAVSAETAKLLEVTEKSLFDGIAEARPGNRVGHISAAVQRTVENAGYSVVRDYVGHGIGTELHEDPQVPNYGVADRGFVLQPGMVLAIEPMVNAGSFDVKLKPDGWTVVTADSRYSAHFEHSVAVTENGPCILSLLEK